MGSVMKLRELHSIVGGESVTVVSVKQQFFCDVAKYTAVNICY
jgi:hypothetical protein